jgi:hypothetical protein
MKQPEPEPKFLNLLSDVELRKSVSLLTLENSSDQKALNRILNTQDGNLTDSQRTWIQRLIDRNGKTWDF